MPTSITRDDLKAVPVFAAEADEHLDWLAQNMVETHHDAGDNAYHYGEDAREMVIILSGTIQLLRHVAGTRRLFDTVGPGKIIGVLPYSRMEHYGGDAAVVEAARLARVDRSLFTEMVHRMPGVGQALVGLMSDRVRSVAREDQQIEKMMALGKLSAGLAHELNNPAAAVGRSADALRRRLHDLQALSVQLASHNLSSTDLEIPEALRSKSLEHVPDTTMSAVLRSEREDELTDWLDGRGVDDAWQYAPALADAGVSIADLDQLAERIPAKSVGAVLAWVAVGLDADRLLHEIEAASARISQLVGSVKAYTHMDRAPEKQATNVRDGLESTLTMLGHRLKTKSISLERSYAPDLPLIQAHAGELNQVWTNLIDNAIDAMREGGHLRIGARREGGMLAVSVVDDGPGIPADVKSRIFEPFFTTKDVGKGTGLGLEIVERIVREHGGDVRVESKPGETAFTVLLPL